MPALFLIMVPYPSMDGILLHMLLLASGRMRRSSQEF
jgi:hypothetical protein